MTDPPPVSSLDADLAHVVRRGRRAVPIAIGFLVAVIVVLAGGMIYLGYVASGERARTDATVRHTTDNMCGFFGSLGSAPLPAATAELGATLVIDGRNIYTYLHCVPRLPPPSQTVVDLAAKYHLKLVR